MGNMSVSEINGYGDLLEPWKAELIVARARRKGFSGDRVMDAQQEVILDVLAFEYDPDNEAGATEETALTSLIDRKLCFILRGEIRARKREELVIERSRSGHYHNDEELPVSVADNCLSRLAVSDLVSSFTRQDRSCAACLLRTVPVGKLPTGLG
jgi:hypothetical protein